MNGSSAIAITWKEPGCALCWASLGEDTLVERVGDSECD